MNNSIVLGVDIGGSHITAALVNLESKNIINASKVREHVNAKGFAKDIISIWKSVINAAFDEIPICERRLGIAMPGPFDYEEGISLMLNQEKYDYLHGLNIKQILSQELDIPASCFQFLNDAECFLKGEVFGGAAKGVNTAVGLTLGTGLGSSIYKDGKVEDANLWCSAFLDSTAEEYLSTRWFTKRFTVLTGVQVKDVKEILGMELYDKVKKQIFQEFGKNLALFLNSAMAEDKPEAIILGGNISNAYELFKETLHFNLSNVFTNTIISKTVLGEEACLIGAASSWQEVNAVVI